MKISGIQYYWLIAVGLLAGWVGFIVNATFGPIDTLHSIPFAAIMIATLFSIPAHLAVVLEIWDRFGLIFAILALLMPPSIVIYWFSRINGYGAAANVS